MLADLHADNFFVQRKAPSGGAPAAYELHPLFREFLRSRALQVLGTTVVDEMRRKAAALLEAAGDVDAAAQLLIDAGDTGRLATLIEHHAETLVRHSRFVTLGCWLDRLPDSMVERTAWLAMWRGLCQLAARDGRWRATLAHAKRLFDETGDVVGSCAVRAGRCRSQTPPRKPVSLPMSCARSSTGIGTR